MRTRLFLALLTTAILAVSATSIAARVAFVRGFLGYLNQQELYRLNDILPALGDWYASRGSWEPLRQDPRPWFDAVARLEFNLPRPPPPQPGWPGQAPPLFGRFDARFTPPPPLDLTGLGMRIALLDAEHRFIIGNPAAAKDALLQPVTVGDAVVGWLAVMPFNRIATGAADELQRRQLMSTWIIGAAAVALAALTAIVLTQRLARPIRRIGAATRRLAAGDYTTRLDVAARDEIGRLAADFNRMALILENNEKLRRSFMADISHELRTPIAILRAELEALEDKVREPTPESLRSLQNEVATLGNLVNDLYDLALADVGALTYRASCVDIANLLQRRLHAFGPRFNERDIAISAQMPSYPLVVRADEIRLQQVFNNVMENSLRYTNRGGRLSVECRYEADQAVVDVQDSEPAVPPELLPRLFDRFYRVDPSRSRATGGTGLGLAIARSIVVAHGGAIEARSSPLGGLWIRVSLPG